MAVVLALNAGSSTLKAAAHRRNEDGSLTELFRDSFEGNAAETLGSALARVTRRLGEEPIVAAGHRVVHGGTRFPSPVVIDAAVLEALEELVPLAPLHQPGSLAVIRALTARLPDLPQVACFDTSFHRGHPILSDLFALPRSFAEQGIRRYGFHGLSYEFLARTLRTVAPEVADGRVIVAHLGNGASLCALRHGKSVDSTMTFTPLDGLVMGTRCGDLDPGVVLHLLRSGWDLPRLERLLYHESGLLGLSGKSPDMRKLLADESEASRLAVDFFVHRVVKESGALASVLGGLDAYVFTAGIGEHAPSVRSAIGAGLAWLGLELDVAANTLKAGGSNAAPRTPGEVAAQSRISTPQSRVAVFTLPTDEEEMIALHTLETLRRTP